MVAVLSEIWILSRGQEHQEPQADGAGTVLVSPACPFPLVVLLRGKILQAAIVHLAHITRNDLAEFRARNGRLGLA